MITLDRVNKWYNRGKPNEVYALKDISLTVEQNETVCVQGASGSGKSTLLSIIGCLFVPTSGTALIDGRQIGRLPDRFLTLYRRKTIGFIFQRFNLLAGITVLNNVSLPLLPLGISYSEQRRRAEAILEKLSIHHRKDFDISEISGGELQRAAIARALINDPPLVVADEPTAHLDSQLSNEFMSVVTELKAQGKTVIIASHDPLVSEHQVVDRCLNIKDGCLTG